MGVAWGEQNEAPESFNGRLVMRHGSSCDALSDEIRTGTGADCPGSLTISFPCTLARLPLLTHPISELLVLSELTGWTGWTLVKGPLSSQLSW